MVVVEMLTGCGAVTSVAADASDASDAVSRIVVVVVDDVAVAAATRIQHRTPRLRLRAPSTPAELVIPGFVMYCRERRLSTPYPYSVPSFGMKRSNPESGVAVWIF
jgi:hypothetical protein